MKLLEANKKILEKEPVPSPWYAMLCKDVFKIDGIPLTWKIFLLNIDNEIDDSRIMLVDDANTAYIILKYGCYIKLIGGSQVVIWYYSSDPTTREYFVDVFDITDLKPIDLKKAHKVLADEIKPTDHPMSTVSFGYYAEFENDPISFKIPNNLPQGNNSVALPEKLQIEDDLILHGYYAVESHNYGKEYNNPFVNPLCILLLKSKIRQLEVICVDWFNKENWDLYYQWITRVARDDRTRKFVCEGIRIGIFLLDKSGKKLDKWVLKDDFYMYPNLDPLRKQA